MAGGGISGLAVAEIAAGGVLVYAGLRGVNPLTALRDITSGNPPGLPESTLTSLTTTGEHGDVRVLMPKVSGAGAKLVRAAMNHAGEKYSQIKRWQPGFSDCSSFVGKAFKDIGIKPPGLSLAINYQTWSSVIRIPRSAVAAGDLISAPTHILIATSNTQGIGQQNNFQNVQTGPIESLIAGVGPYMCLRYKWSTQADRSNKPGGKT